MEPENFQEILELSTIHFATMIKAIVDTAEKMIQSIKDISDIICLLNKDILFYLVQHLSTISVC
jgi:hypothetical protein